MDTSWEIKVNGPFWTGICTPAALDTVSGRKGDLQPWILGLRAVAEDTPKGTSLEEDHTADTGAILKAVPFDIHNKRKIGHLRHLCDTESMGEIPGHETKPVDVV